MEGPCGPPSPLTIEFRARGLVRVQNHLVFEKQLAFPISPPFGSRLHRFSHRPPPGLPRSNLRTRLSLLNLFLIPLGSFFLFTFVFDA